jgi:hypothetical protein
MQQVEEMMSFGVFNPVGHVVAAFPRGTDIAAVEGALGRVGFGKDKLRRMSADEMLARADADLTDASPLDTFGHALNLVSVHRDMAAAGNSFLIIEARTDETIRLVTEIAIRFGTSGAQSYGRWTIEDLIKPQNDVSPPSGAA